MSMQLQLLVVSEDTHLPPNLLKRLRDHNLLNGLEWSSTKDLLDKADWDHYYAVLILSLLDPKIIEKLTSIHIPKVLVIAKNQLLAFQQILESDAFIGDIPVFLEHQDRLLVETLQAFFDHATRVTANEPYYTEEFLLTTLGALGDGVIVSDFNRRVQYMNQAARMICRYYGNTKDIDFESLFSIESPNQMISELFLVERMLKEQKPFGLHRDAMLRDQEGKAKFISASVTPLLVEKQGQTGIAVVFRDISRIREAEKRLHIYSEAIRQSLESVVITDSDLNVLSANLKFYETFKCKRESLVGTRVFELSSIKGQISEEEIKVELLHYGLVRKQVSLKMFDSTYHFRLMINAVMEDDAIYYLITLVDMTKQVEAELRLKKEQENLNTIFEGLPLGVLILNEKKEILRTNKAVSEIFNTDIDSMLGKGPGSAYRCSRMMLQNSQCDGNGNCPDCPINKAIDFAFNQKVGVTGEDVLISVLDNLNNLQDKWIRVSIVLFDLAGEPSILMVIEDVTQTKAIAQNLIQNEHRLRLITDNMIDTVTQVNKLGKILYASPSHWNLMGYTQEYLIGKSLIDFIHPEDQKKAVERMQRRLSGGESFVSEIRIKRKDGAYIWLESMGNVLEDLEGETSIVYVSRDVTIKRQVLDEMQLAKDAAEAANKAKSEFLANMSHEIRTPMNGIIGMTNLTLMSALNEDQRENLSLVKNSAENLLKIINSILDFSKIEAGKIILEVHPFNLRQTLAKVINPLKVEADNKSIILSAQVDSSVTTIVKGDSNRLIQILNNLLSNALKFTHKGKVHIQVSKVGSKHHTTFMKFDVSDTGIGIAEEDHHKLFDSFSQVDGSMTRRYGGTGLGLSITKQLVEIMGGKISFQSALGQGTTFTFELPFHEVDQYIPTEEKSFSVPSPKKHLRVLLVEDDPVNQALAVRLLEKQFHEVTLAKNGEEALSALAKLDFDIVLMDIQMPLMDGVIATKHIRAQVKYRSLPIVALTAHAIKGDEERFLSAGMDAYISKPIQIDQFYRVLDELTTDRKTIREILEHVSEQATTESLTEDEINDYLVELVTYRDKLIQAVENRQYQKCEEIAHYIKNLAVTAHDKEIKRWALRLEMAARKESYEPLNASTGDLIKAIEGMERGSA